MKFGPFEIKGTGMDVPARDFRSHSCVGGSKSTSLLDSEDDDFTSMKLRLMRDYNASNGSSKRIQRFPNSRKRVLMEDEKDRDVQKRRNVIKHNIYVSWMKEVGNKFKVNLYNSAAYDLFSECFSGNHYRLPTKYEVQSKFLTPNEVREFVAAKLNTNNVATTRDHLAKYHEQDKIELVRSSNEEQTDLDVSKIPREPTPNGVDLDYAVQGLVFQGYETLGNRIFDITPSMLRTRGWSPEGIDYFRSHCKLIRDMQDMSRVPGTEDFNIRAHNTYSVQSGSLANSREIQGEDNTYPPYGTSVVTCSSALRDVPSPPERDMVDPVFVYCDKIIYHYYARGKIHNLNLDREALFAKGWTSGNVRTLKYVALYYKNLAKNGGVSKLHGLKRPYSNVSQFGKYEPQGGSMSTARSKETSEKAYFNYPPKQDSSKKSIATIGDNALYRERGDIVTYDQFRSRYKPQSGMAAPLMGTEAEAAAFTGNSSEQDGGLKSKSSTRFGPAGTSKDVVRPSNQVGTAMDDKGREIQLLHVSGAVVTSYPVVAKSMGFASGL